MKRILFVLTLSIFSLNSFAASQVAIQPKEISQQKASIELYIDAKGRVYVNGKKMSSKKIEKMLIDIKSKKGIVKFAIENKHREMTSKGLEVVKLFRKHEISVEVFTDKTFSKQLSL